MPTIITLPTKIARVYLVVPQRDVIKTNAPL